MYPYDEQDYEIAGQMLGQEEMLGQFPGLRRIGPAGRFPAMARPPMMRRPFIPPGRSFVVPPPGAGLPMHHPLLSAFPGAAGPAGVESNVGFGSVVFDNTSALTFALTARPQRLVRPKQLVVIVTRSAAAVAEAITVGSLTVGPINQFSNAVALPAEMFSADGTTRLIGTSAAPGTDIVLVLNCSANPGVGETVTVTAALNVDAIG